MPKFIVNRNTGWPVDTLAHAHGEEFDADASAEINTAVESGYLNVVEEPKPQPSKRGVVADVPVIEPDAK